MKTVGIVGCGVIGGALKKWLEDNTEHKICVSDPYKGYNDDMSNCDVFFVQIHIPTEADGTQNLDVLRDIIKKLPATFFRTLQMSFFTKEIGQNFCINNIDIITNLCS